MPKLRVKDLHKLYPAPKSYAQIRAERERRQLARRPKYIELKISSWTTLGVLSAIVVTNWIYQMMTDGPMSLSTSVTLSSVAFSLLFGMAELAIIYYLFSLVTGLANRVILSPTLLYYVLTVIVAAGVIFGWNAFGDLLLLGTTLVFVFLVTYFSTHFALKHNK